MNRHRHQLLGPVLILSFLGALPSVASAVTPIVKIHEIQGSGDTSPLVGQTVAVEAIVVGDFQNGDGDVSRELGGFFLQEENADADADAATSEGIFVFEGNATF